MFIWMAKFGAAYGVRTGIHVGVDVLVNRLNPFWRKKVTLFALLCGALFTAIVGTMGLKFVVDALPYRSGLARHGDPELDRLRLHTGRLLFDVLPLSAGFLEIFPDRRTAAS